MEDFLEIFKIAFHKINLQEVALLSKLRNSYGRRYYKFVGKFEFMPPDFVWNDSLYAALVTNKSEILHKFNSIEEQSAKCIKRKFTKKLRSDDEVKKVDFEFVFDIIPRRVVNYEFNVEKKKMYLYVVGYGM